MTQGTHNKLAASLFRLVPVNPASLGALRRPQFVSLAVQQFLSLAATYAISFASMAKVVESTSSGVQAAFTILSVVVPGLLFGLLGGVTVDRVSRRTMLVATNVIRGLIALLAPVYMGSLDPGAVVPVILAVNFLLSAVGQFNFPAEAALIPYLVANEELTAANSAFNISYLAAIAFGGGVMGPLSVRLLGPEWTYFFGGVLFAITLIPLGFVAKDPPPRERAMRKSRYARLRHVSAFFADVEEGVSFCLSNSAVSVAILSLISQTALALSLAAVFPVVLQTRFGVAMYNLPLLLAPAAIGAGLGLFWLLSRAGARRRRTFFVATGNGFVALGLLGYTLSIWLPELGIWGILGSSPLIGAGFVMSYISAKSTLQEEPPAYLCGRVISLQLTLNNVVSLLPTILAGWALDSFGPLVVFVTATLVFGGFVVLGLRPAGRVSGP